VLPLRHGPGAAQVVVVIIPLLLDCSIEAAHENAQRHRTTLLVTVAMNPLNQPTD
jgi:hypothetical protein